MDPRAKLWRLTPPAKPLPLGGPDHINQIAALKHIRLNALTNLVLIHIVNAKLPDIAHGFHVGFLEVPLDGLIGQPFF